MDSFEIFRELPTVNIKKGTVLISAGDKAEMAYYVEKGCLRSYVLDQKGKEHIFQFAPEDWIISDLELMKHGGGAYLYIDAIEDSEVKVIPMSMMNSDIYSQREVMESVLKKFQNRVYSLQNEDKITNFAIIIKKHNISLKIWQSLN